VKRGWLCKASRRYRVSTTRRPWRRLDGRPLPIALDDSGNERLGRAQADVEGAYLNGKLDVELYMAYPKNMTPKAG
jgi:hypothetical protein